MGSSLLIAVLTVAGAAATLSLAAAVMDRGGSRRSAAMFAVGWLVFAFVPVAWGIFGGRTAWYAQAVGAYDFAGAIPFHLGGGVAALAIVLLIPRAQRQEAWRAQRSNLKGAMALTLLAVLWIAWLALMELDLNELAFRVVVTATILGIASMTAGAVVQFIRTRRMSIAGGAVGLVAGLAAATAAAPFLEPAAAAATGLITGSLSGAIAFGRGRERTPSIAGFIAVTNLSGATVGLLMIGLLDRGRGFFYTGAMTLSVAQLTAIVVCVVYVALISAPLGMIAGGHLRRKNARERLP